ncbi:neuronal acetylcholine receptor subunit alpha-4-like [Scaptodrosophila lebanonensis]|uniref:Neuronal acetylcholine receptor subunit alpha-4-like n=1 Tax=Drosophila lebanonensis TaxID=7225 RepID=A0A6J2U8W2_DROLE|nr:neuronal acetylcholine receptor subunit alpha-4-like [Scaptodrosophila lebanonensis]
MKIDLTIYLTLIHFEFRPTDGNFHFVGHLDVSWMHTKLKWNPTQYGNITHVLVGQNLVWVPDLELYNNAPNKMISMHKKGVITLAHDGRIDWMDTIDMSIFCTGNMQEYPLDSHSCNLTMGSWTYDGLDIDINKKGLNRSINFDQIDQTNMGYKVTNFTAMYVSTLYSCCTEPYITINYSIQLERNTNMVVIFRASAICVIVLGLLSSIESIELRQKILVAAIAYFTIFLHLQHFTKTIGQHSRITPSIVKFYAYSLVIITFTTIMSVRSKGRILSSERTIYFSLRGKRLSFIFAIALYFLCFLIYHV